MAHVTAITDLIVLIIHDQNSRGHCICECKSVCVCAQVCVCEPYVVFFFKLFFISRSRGTVAGQSHMACGGVDFELSFCLERVCFGDVVKCGVDWFALMLFSMHVEKKTQLDLLISLSSKQQYHSCMGVCVCVCEGVCEGVFAFVCECM